MLAIKKEKEEPELLFNLLSLLILLFRDLEEEGIASCMRKCHTL